MLKKLNQSWIIETNIKADKMIILMSTMMDDILKEVELVQHQVYSRPDARKNEIHFIYTNNLNIVFDTLFRIVYKISEMIHQVKKRYKVSSILFLDDLTHIMRTHDEEYYKRIDKRMRTKDLFTGDDINQYQMLCKIANRFKSYCFYMPLDEEEDFEPMETYLASQIPKLYDFTMKDILANRKTNKFDPNYRKDKFKAKIQLIQAITQYQARMTIQEVEAIYEFIIQNIKTMKTTHIKYIRLKPDYDIMNIYSLFPHENVIYYFKYKPIKHPNAFYYYKHNLYYPMLELKSQIFNIPNISSEDVVAQIVDTTKDTHQQRKLTVNTFAKLISVCMNECYFGVLDINGNYRYTFFENMKQLIVEEKLDVLMPDKLEDYDFVWITIEDYMENLPVWVSQFNSFSDIKIILQ